MPLTLIARLPAELVEVVINTPLLRILTASSLVPVRLCRHPSEAPQPPLASSLAQALETLLTFQIHQLGRIIVCVLATTISTQRRLLWVQVVEVVANPSSTD